MTPSVEWHTIGAYRVSFDVRLDASRFIVMLDGELVGSGLVDADVVQFDQEVDTGIALIGAMMHTRWLAMVERLRGRPRGDV